MTEPSPAAGTSRNIDAPASKRPRVVQVGKYYYPYMGGIEQHLYTLCNELKGHADVDAVVSNKEPVTVRDVVDGVAITRCAEIGHLASTSLNPTMAVELSQRRYDVCHVHLPHPVGIASYLLSQRPRNHVLVVSYHSDVVRQQTLRLLYDPLVNRLLDRADIIIATSPNYVETSDTLQRFRDKCHVLPYGIDLDLYQPTSAVLAKAEEIRRNYGRPILLAVGRLIYYKGFEYAIRAMQHVTDAVLLIAGNGPLRGDLERLARELGVTDRVVFLGEIHNADLPPYYRAASVYLLPSIARSEAFAIVQLEAMACGTPVINTSLPSGVPFVSLHGETGLTVPPSDASALAGAIRELLADEGRRTALGIAGRQRVQRYFSKERMARQMLRVYASPGSYRGVLDLDPTG